MELEQIEVVFRYHAENVWVGRSDVTVTRDSGHVSITVLMGSESVPVHVTVHAGQGLQRPVVEMMRGAAGPMHGLSDPRVIAKIGGTLIQVSNMLDQIAGLEVPDAR